MALMGPVRWLTSLSTSLCVKSSVVDECCVMMRAACPCDVRLLLALKPDTDSETQTTIFESHPPDYVDFRHPDVSAYFDAGIPGNDI
jgi:hypothetical protein